MMDFSGFAEAFISQTNKILQNVVYEMQAATPADMSADSLLNYVQETLISDIVSGESKSLYFSHFEQYVRNHLQHLIERETQQCLIGESNDDLVSLYSESLMKSEEYGNLISDICCKIGQTLETVSAPLNLLEDASKRSFFKSQSVSPVNDSDTSSLTSSFGTGYWELPSSERLQELAEALDPHNPREMREIALRTLYSLSLTEVVKLDTWPNLKQRITRVLVSPEESTVKLGLSVHTKMLYSSSNTCMIEGFISLMDALMHSLETAPDNCFHSLECPTANCYRAFQICGLLNAFQMTVPKYWARFAEKHLKVLVDVTVSRFLTCKWATASSKLTPFHILALLDLNAKWFFRWTRGHRGRMLLFEQMKEYSNVLSSLVTECLRYFDLSGCQDETESRHVARPSTFTSCIRYCCALHSVAILGCVLSSSQGTDLLESQLSAARLETSSTDFLHHLVQVAVAASKVSSDCNFACVGQVVAGCVLGVIRQDSSCQRHFSDGRILCFLVEQLNYWSSGPEDEVYDMAVTDLHAFHHVTSILLCLVESVVGLNTVLGQNGHETLTAIATFSKKILLVSERGLDPPHDKVLEAVKTSVVKICCHIMSTYDGVRILGKSVILHRIAEDWVSILQDDKDGKQTPVPSAACKDLSDKRARDNNASSDWLAEFTTIGCTPQGLAVLYDVELLHDVLAEIEKEIIAGKETAVACSVEPSLAGHMMNLVNLVFDNVRMSLEDGNSLQIGNRISLTATDQLEHLLHQSLSDILSILPSCYGFNLPALWTSVASGMDTATSANDLCCQLHFGLLNLLATNLDTWIGLQSRYSLLDKLVEMQQVNITDASGYPEIDYLFLLRGRLLIKVTEIGGEHEKYIPPLFLNQDHIKLDELLKQWPSVTCVPIPPEYLMAMSPLQEPPPEIQQFLKESNIACLDDEWLIYCRELFRTCLADKEIQFRGKWYGTLLYFATEAMLRLQDCGTIMDFAFTNDDGQSSELQQKGLKTATELIFSYGTRLNLLEDEESVWNNLCTVMQELQQESRGLIGGDGTDWIGATSFLLMNSDPQRTLNFRQNLRALAAASRANSSLKEESLGLSSNFWITFCHNVEVVLHGDLPMVAHALKRSGVAIGQVCLLWINQCFLNILDWEDICSFFGLCLLMGDSYMVYFVVALFRHLQTDLLRHVEGGSAALFLKDTRAEGFCTSDYLPFMDHLESKYRGTFQ